MAKKSTPKRPTKSAAARKAAPVAKRKTSGVRNSPIPKKPSAGLVRKTSGSTSRAGAAKSQITYEMISERAYFISQSGTGGAELENWLRAERELRG